ncbi:MAG TPA: osmotically inducible protein OsmC [Acidimicrobiaceae bacterium]|nr:osmotically inducible protein OsmC [Acidimicrobiaceae bacterium]
MRVAHVEQDRFDITIRQHTLGVDQPRADGGSDTAPTPTELFVASLASCVAFYVRRFLDRHGLSTEGLAVDASYSMASGPARVDRIGIVLQLPEGIPEDRIPALMAVATHCTVHNSLVEAPEVQFDLEVGERPLDSAVGM